MSNFSQAINLDSVTRSRAEVRSLASLLLPSLGVVVFAVTFFQVLFLSQGAAGLFRDSDTGWHVRNGEAILDTRVLPAVDRFSYTHEGRTWFAWEWLSDIMLAGAHRAGGLPAVALLSALAIAFAAWGSVRLSLSLGGNLFFTAVAVALLLGVTSIHWLARPHVFSWGLALLFLALVEHRRGLFLLPLLSCIWANLHGSFLLGPAILFIYAIGSWLYGLLLQCAGGAADCSPGREPWEMFVAGTASFLATFVNPYGWQLHRHVIAYLRNDYLMNHISEFRSFSFHSAGALYVEVFLLLAVLGTLALLKQRAFGPALLGLALLHLSLYSARHLATAAVLLLPLCIAALTREASGWPQLRSFLDYSERLHSIDRKIWGVVPVVVVLVITFAGLSKSVGFNPAKFPAQAADFLEQNNLRGRVFAKDQWGGYLIYRFAGRMKVFIDGRSDFYGTDFLETYAVVAEAKPNWDEVLKQYDVRFVLVAPETALSTVLRLSPRWKQVHADPVAAVFEVAESSAAVERPKGWQNRGLKPTDYNIPAETSIFRTRDGES